MLKVLVVDDEPLVLNTVAAILRKRAFDVLAAKTGEEAFAAAIANSGEIDLLVVNHSVNARPGRSVVETILPVQPMMKVLRFSGHAEDDLRAKGEIRPESSFLQKPFTATELIEKVLGIIGADRASV